MITLNEEKAISKVINDIKTVLPRSEILIVDSSSDQTPEIAANLGCKVIRQFPPKGYGKAMELALLSAGNNIIITLDCDDTYPTEKIPELVYWIEQGFDIVNASRLANKKPKNMPFGNYLANRFFAYAIKVLFGISITDAHSGMRGYKREMIHNLQWHPDGAAFPVELLIKPIQKGYKMKEISIEYNERVGEVTMRRFSSTWWTIKRLYNLKFSKENN
jgi:glycosyltransferase involved in cell wall biosynthesis